MRLSALLVLLFTATASAEPIYSWTDRDGEQHFTNDPTAVPKGVSARLLVPAEPSVSISTSSTSPSTAPAPKPADAAATTSEPTGREDEVVTKVDRRAWRPAESQSYDPAFAPAFVRVADTSSDPVVITAALKGIGSLYSPNPGAGATHNGKPYQRLACTDAVYRVAKRHLDHDDFHVRGEAAAVVGLGVWGPSPRDELVKALASRIEKESDPGVLDRVRIALWSCHCNRPELVDAALSGTARADVGSQFNGLSVMALAGKDGRDFDAASRDRMRHEAERFLDHPQPMIRAAAITAWRTTTTEPADAIRAKLTALTTSSEPFVRHTAVTLLGRDTNLASIPPLLAALSDTSVASVKPQEGLPGMTTRSIAESALAGLAKVSGRAMSRGGFSFEPGKAPLEGAALASEVTRARKWAAENARALKLPPP